MYANIFFTKSGCPYIYNPDLTCPPRPGDYKVQAVIDNQPASGGATCKVQ